jgi:hypothetical protein
MGRRRAQVAVPLDQPRGVVAVDEAADGLAQLVDGVVQLDPQALLLEGADPALGAAVGLRLAQEGGVVGDAEPADRAQEVARAVRRSPVVSQQKRTASQLAWWSVARPRCASRARTAIFRRRPMMTPRPAIRCQLCAKIAHHAWGSAV